MVDKNLFPYDLAVVAILKNEGPYVKEWLDYHLVAGVDHFYLYDNESPDNYNEVVKPYVDRGLVTNEYTVGPRSMINVVYNDFVRQYKFHCRYAVFVDLDEFVFPKGNRSISETLDEIFSLNPTAGGVLINWHCFGSNGQEKADFTRGVMERFTRRAENDWYRAPDQEPDGYRGWLGNIHVKTATNPRKIAYMESPHYANYFTGVNTIDEDGNPIRVSCFKLPITENKIVFNHYASKSLEEYTKRKNSSEWFELFDRNEVFDDGILKYRDARKAAGGGMENIINSKQVDYPRLFNALVQNLAPVLSNQVPREFFANRVENFLTCLNLTAYLKGKFIDDKSAEIFEELSLNALYQSLLSSLSVADFELLMKEMPKILVMPYPAVEKICTALIQLVTQMLKMSYDNGAWQRAVDWEHELEWLRSFQPIKN